MPREIAAFHPLADLLPEPMLVVGLDGTIQASNRAFAASMGWHSDEMANRPLADYAVDAREALAEFLRHCASTSGLLFGGITLRGRDGTETPWRAEGAALPLTGIADERVIVLRLIRRESAIARFVHLNQQLASLSTEVVRRRHAERAAADALERERRVRDRLAALARASGALMTSTTVDDVLPAIGELAVSLIPADAHAVWHCAPEDRRWRTVWRQGLSDSFVGTIEREAGSLPQPVMSEPLWVEDVDEMPMLEGRRSTYAREGIRSLIVIPLHVNDAACGTVVAYYRRRIGITEDDRCVAAALGNLASGALATTTLHEAEASSRQASQRAADHFAFLARVSNALAGSLDYETTLATVARLAVPEIADWCAVDIVSEQGVLKRLAVAHVDPAKVRLASELHDRYPPDPASPHGAAHALRTGTPIMMSRIPDELIAASASDPEHLSLLRSLGLRSYISVPLMTRGRAFGVLTFVSAESGREYTDDDMRLAEDVAGRAALAVEHSRAYREVQRVNRVKDEFLATLSHELRTPLNAVLGYARMIRSGLLDSDQRARAFEVLERNAVSLNQIVEDVLDVSRIVAGKIRLNVGPLDLPLVLRDAAATVRPAAEARRVRLTTIIDPVIPPVAGDQDRLQQVVWNLLSNAVKFTPRDGQVELRLRQSGSSVHIEVADTGAGIRKDFLPHLFEPFSQEDAGFSRRHGGLGLGLAIARRIVEMHGGLIEAASDGEGKGSTFTVTLPVAAVAHPQPADGPTARSGSAGLEPLHSLTHQLDGIRVLVVDDDRDARMLISDVLQSAGAQVVTADSAQAALDRLASEEAPHVLLTDVGMPGMDGFALMQQIRQSPRLDVREVPAIALTAYARSEDRVRALDNGCQMHIAKPIGPSELVAAVRGLTARMRSA